MKRFVGHIVLFSVLVLAFFAAGEAYVERMPNPSRDKHQWMERHAGEVTTLILGNSHTFYGIRPDSLPECAFSLAQVSQTYRYDDYLLHNYDMPWLKRVVIPFSYMSLWEDFESQEDKWFNAIRYCLYMDCDIHSRLSRYGWECRAIPSFKEKLKGLMQPPQLSWDSLGWGTNYVGHRFEQWDNGRQRVDENTYQDTAVVALNMGYLTRMLTWCREQSVCVVLVEPPVSATYHACKNAFQDSVNKMCINDILRRFPEVRYLDLEQDSRFVADDFYDADHLNVKGAEKLTAIIRTAF